jgi:glycosyltransferase involved in cell wall biosynthesis
VPEVVQEGVTGFLAQGSDPDTLARAIGRALEHPERLSAMGARARRLYEEQFEPDMALGRMVGFYSSLVEGRAGRRS